MSYCDLVKFYDADDKKAFEEEYDLIFEKEKKELWSKSCSDCGYRFVKKNTEPYATVMRTYKNMISELKDEIYFKMDVTKKKSEYYKNRMIENENRKIAFFSAYKKSDSPPNGNNDLPPNGGDSTKFIDVEALWRKSEAERGMWESANRSKGESSPYDNAYYDNRYTRRIFFENFVAKW